MSTQHTPGPWEYGAKDDGIQMSALCTIHNVPRLATEDGMGQGWAYVSAPKKCFEINEEEREANGRLMAAAPELLEVLAEYLMLGAGRCTIGRQQADKALAVIRKATGGQS